MQIRITDLRASALHAIYLRLAALIEEEIGRGAVPIGERLPSERTLARTLRVSRTTIVAAYQELEARGVVRRQVGRGTYVSARPVGTNASFAWEGKLSAESRRVVPLWRDEPPRGLISFAEGLPASEALAPEVQEALGRAVATGAAASFKRGAGAAANLREIIASRCDVTPDEILVASGSQQALTLISQALIDPGDRVIVDSPGRVGATEAFRVAGATPVAWRAPRWSLDELEELLIRHRPKFIYTNPTYQNPTSASMPIATRAELLELAYRYHTPVLEDVAYEPLSIDEPPPPSLRTLDRQGVVIQIHSLSSGFAPVLRLGWVIAPPELVTTMRVASRKSGSGVPLLVQHVASEVLGGQVYERCVAAVRDVHNERRMRFAAAIRASGLLDADTPRGGLYFWCRMRNGWDSNGASAAARQHRVGFSPGHIHYGEKMEVSRRIRLCYTSLPPEVAAEGIARLARMLETPYREPESAADILRSA